MAHRNSLHIYLTSTSLLNRSIKLSIDRSRGSLVHIVDYVSSPTNPEIIWVACSNGLIYRVNWASGEGWEKSWKSPSKRIIHMTVASMGSAERMRDVVFTAEKDNEGWRISAHELSVLGTSPTNQSRVIYKSAQTIQILKASDEGTIIVAASEEKVLLGALRSTEFGTIDKIRYEFRIFESTAVITSLDVRISNRDSFSGETTSKLDKVKVVDIVVGDVKGSIFVHNDLLRNLIMSQKSAADAQNPISLIPRKLHWHRKAVHCVKWSLDGLSPLRIFRLVLTFFRTLYNIGR